MWVSLRSVMDVLDERVDYRFGPKSPNPRPPRTLARSLLIIHISLL